MKAPLTERCCGRWLSILPLMGIGRQFLSAKHGPCPICGGTDRYRFTNRNGSGDWICNQCQSGDGVELVKRYLKLDFKEAAERIEAIFGETRIDRRPMRPQRDEQAAHEAMKRLWDSASPITAGSPAARYLRHTRGLSIAPFPPCLRFHPHCPYDHREHLPAILAKVIGPDNKPANIHRIFITPDGRKTPRLPARKLMKGSLPPGSAVRFMSAGQVLGVSTGIETSLAAQQISGVPVWATLVDGGLERFVLPEGVEHLMIFGDNDRSFSGQKSAYILANKAVIQWRIKAEVLIPDGVKDWNDFVKLQQEGVAA